MFRRILPAALVLGGVLGLGCDKDDKPNTGSPAGQTAPKADVKIDMKSEVKPDAKTETKVNAAKADAATGSDTAKAAAAGGAEVQAQATELLKKAADYLKDAKLDDAEGVLRKLELIKGQLPASYQDQITSMRSKFNTVKAASGGLKALDKASDLLPGTTK